ncbi:MAG TPA: hypothetical protein VK815_01155 [Candidatus Acidoferrales bacterium]|jgi:hypothetical protein|nr:hypothetical protein [Candidatus Acidoferrales bacterium]
MKPLKTYAAADWCHLRPLTHFIKTTRYRVVDHLHMHRLARAGDLAALQGLIRGKKLMVTVAFSDPQAIGWQARLIRHYVPHALYLIADNSPDEASASAISALATQHGFPYLRLPANPWHKGSRSHGIALNWLCHNLIRPGEPEMFGFLDHDLFPTAPDDPFNALASQDFYGLVRQAGALWFLWAGFCFYRFAGVRDKKLDFGQDWFNGLDTGGGNWRTLYRFAGRPGLREAASTTVSFNPGVTVADGPIQWVGPWLHEIGMTGRQDLVREKRQFIAALLKEHLERAGG